MKYGTEPVSLEYDERNIAFRIEPAPRGASVDLSRLVSSSLAAPIGSPRLSELGRGKGQVCIVCDDLTRTTPADVILPHVLAELKEAGITDRQITIVIALGSHRPLSRAEIVQKIGAENARRFQVVNHDCTDNSELVSVDMPDRPFDIVVNRRVAEADCRICIGTIIPHFPSGWSGGAKMLLPGVAGLRTIAQMHYLGATDSSIGLGTIPNPCRELMELFADCVGLDFIVNTVPNAEGETAGVVSGHFVEAHREGVRIGMQHLAVPVPARADLVLASAYPSDMDLLQAGKALFTAERCVKPGGEVILLSPCDEGVAPSHPDIADYCSHDSSELIAGIDSDRWENPLRAAFAIGLKRLAAYAGVSVFTRNIAQAELEKIGFRRISDRRELDDKLAASSRAGKRLGVIDYATKVLPLPPES